MRGIRVLVVAATCLAAQPSTLALESQLDMRVFPSVAMVPSAVLVRAVVAADADNRELIVTAESEDFYRSSRFPLDGDRAPRNNDIRWGGLPPGRYEITVTLVGTQGRRAAASRSLRMLGAGEQP